MKRFLVPAACLLVSAMFSTAIAGNNHAGWGVGISLGEPTGISAKRWSNLRAAYDFGLAWSTSDDSGVALHADYLLHKFDTVEWDGGEVPFYYGLGVRFRAQDEGDDNIGVRIPLGIDYMFADSAFDVFLEIVPIMDLVPDSEFKLNGAVGGRFFF